MTPKEWMEKHYPPEKRKALAPKVAKLINEEKIPLSQAMELADLPPAEQELFIFEACNFTVRSLKAAISHWKKCTPAKQEVIAGIIDDVNSAFDEWDAWTGNKAGEDMDTFQQDVARARGRVLAYIHGLRPPPQGKII